MEVIDLSLDEKDGAIDHDDTNGLRAESEDNLKRNSIWVWKSVSH